MPPPVKWCLTESRMKLRNSSCNPLSISRYSSRRGIWSERERHFAASCELNSDVCHSIHEIAGMISEVTKKGINIRRIGVEQLPRGMYGSSFDPDKLRYEIDAFQSMATWCDKYDLVGNTNVMAWLLNRNPMSMSTYIQQQLEIFARYVPFHY